jgi:uncharacterized membrane protein
MFLFFMLLFFLDIQFWHQNKSLHGLSVLGILFNFLCDLIVALYLYDSKETSYLVLFEIFLGLSKSWICISNLYFLICLNSSFRMEGYQGD